MSASISGRFISMVIAAPSKSYSLLTLPPSYASVNRITKEKSNLQYHRHDQRPPLVLPRDVALQIGADFLLDHAIVGLLFGAGGIEGLDDDLLDALDHAIVAGIEPARHNLG